MKNALKRGGQRLYFPDYPNHELNGASFNHMGSTGEILNGLSTRNKLTVFEADQHNLNSPSGYWANTFEITPKMFNAEFVRVNFWFCGEIDETFYLIN